MTTAPSALEDAARLSDKLAALAPDRLSPLILDRGGLQLDAAHVAVVLAIIDDIEQVVNH